MNKTQLLADLTSKVLKVVQTTEEIDSVKNTAGIRQYVTNVMEQAGENVQGRNIGWYTINEGEATEEAFYRDIVTTKKDFSTKVENYLAGLVPATFLTAVIADVSEIRKTAKAYVVKINADDTVSEQAIFVYKLGATPITHKVIK